MKSKLKVFLVLCFLLNNLLYSQVYSKMQMIPAENWIYDAISTLKREEKSVDILDSAPLSVGELYENFISINYENLSPETQKLFDEVSEFFEYQKGIIDFKPIKVSFNLSLYPEFLYKSNPDIDWTFATDNTGKMVYNYEKNEYQKQNYGAASNFFFNPLARPFLTIPFYLNFSDYICIQSDFFVGKSFSGFDKNNNLTNITFNAGELDYLWPDYAYAACGYLFKNGLGVDLQIGRQGMQFGRTLTGSIIYNNTFQTDSFIKLNLYSKNFRLNTNIVQVYTNHYLYLHSLEFIPFKWIRLGVIEGTYLDQPFEIKYLNPLMIFHSFQTWNLYNSELESKYYRESHTCAYMGITFDVVPFKGARIYGLFAQTEIQPPNELGDEYGRTLPNGVGFQLGSEYTLPISQGYLKFAGEGFYLSPYLYIKQSDEWSLCSKNISGVYTWIGSPVGPDSAGFELSCSYKWIKKLDAGIKYLFVAHGENSFGMFKNSYTNSDGTWAAFFPSVLKHLGLISQEQAETIARDMGLSGTIQYTNQIMLNASYQLNKHFIFDSSLIYCFIFNNKNIENYFSHGIQFTTGCELRLF